jgi:hypothetical protein
MEGRGNMDKYLLKTVAIAAAALALAACSSAPQPAATAEPAATTAPPKPAGPVTGKTAFYEIYKPARTWATDLMPLSLSSGDLPGFKNEDGKAAVWTAIFVSPSLRQARHFTYAIAAAGTVQKGVTADVPEAWSGATKDAMPFQNSDFTVDSDAAYKTVADKAADWLKDHADKKCTMTLASAARFPAPVWVVMWGDSRSGGYAQYVNAATGALVTK